MTAKEHDQDRADEFKALWREHPYTKYLVAKAIVQRDQAIQLLLGKCADSTDPNVVRSYASYLAIQKRIDTLKSGDL